MSYGWIQGYGARCGLAAGAGLLLAVAFPKPGWAAAAWIAPGLMLLAAFGFRGRQAFGIGYAAGLAFWLASLNWLLFIPYFGGPVVGWLALSAYLALYQAVWVWLSLRVGEVSWRKIWWPVLCAATWVALEMIRSRLFTGFPWSLLGVSQYQMPPLIQLASFTGVYGVSFLLVWCSVALIAAGRILAEDPTRRWAWLGALIVPLTVLLCAMFWGTLVLSRLSEVKRTLKVALVQPSIPQTLIWDPKESTNRFRKLIELSELALKTQPQLLIWPEAAVPNLLRFDPEFTGPAITNLVTKHRTWLLFGADDAELRQPPRDANDYAYFNASFLASPEGRFPAMYRKRQLVIFGEYIPLARWLPFLKWFTPIGEGFASGTGPVPFRMPDLGVSTSVLICFEDIFPHLARHYVFTDTDFLVNITNDGWFGESSAQWQHAANAVFRAVENRLPLVRCANNGITCWIDAGGRMHEVYFGDSSDVYLAGIKTAGIPLLKPGETRAFTWYRRYGDWFGWGCMVVTVLSAIRLRIIRFFL